MLTDNYKPKSLKEFIGQQQAVESFLNFMKKKSEKGLLLYGPSGTGKTALLEAYAREKDIELVQMNAGDVRSEEEIAFILGCASRQMSLSSRRKIILLDEVDSIGGGDRGGVGAIVSLIKESSYPVVLIASNPWTQKLRPLRQYCNLVEFKRLSTTDVMKKLQQISNTEKIRIDIHRLNEIAKRSNGDMRAAINDLEIVSKGSGELGERETSKDIFELLRQVFKSKSMIKTNMDLDPENIFWWIENNIVNEYEKPDELAKAYDALSRADLFRQRIRHKQNWRLFPYFIDLMTSGVTVSKKNVYKKFTRYQFPNMSLRRSNGLDRERVAELSKLLHCSTRKVKLEYLPLKFMAKP